MRGCAWGQGSHSSLITLASLLQRKHSESHMRRAQMCRSGHSSAAGLAAPPRSLCPAQHRHSTSCAESGKRGACLQRWVPGTGRSWTPSSGCPQGQAASRQPSESPGTRPPAAPVEPLAAPSAAGELLGQPAESCWPPRATEPGQGSGRSRQHPSITARDLQLVPHCLKTLTHGCGGDSRKSFV